MYDCYGLNNGLFYVILSCNYFKYIISIFLKSASTFSKEKDVSSQFFFFSSLIQVGKQPTSAIIITKKYDCN